MIVDGADRVPGVSTRFIFPQLLPGSGLLRLRDLDAVVAVLHEDGLVVLPTETGYMLAALISSQRALERAFLAKGRAAARVMHVACSSTAMIESIGTPSSAARRLLAEFTPGPLSVIIEKLPSVPEQFISVNGTVGVRVPDHPATLQVVAAAGVGLTATSLNRSGAAPIEVTEAGLRALDWPDGVVPVVLDPAAVRYSQPSTLVRMTGPEPEVLRAGAVSEARVRAALALS